MIDDFARALIKEITERRDSLAAGVLSGQLDHDKYKYHCGEIHGLDLAVDQIKAVLQKVEDSSDE